MNKVIRNGKVAVLVSGGYGAGWSTWNYDFPECLFDPEIVEMVEQEKSPQEIADFAQGKYGRDFYPGGSDSLYVYWVPQGSEFLIDEYKGSESLHQLDSILRSMGDIHLKSITLALVKEKVSWIVA